MPLHEYKCPKCGEKFERIVRFADAETHPCPKCGEKSEQLLSVPSPFQWEAGKPHWSL
jgi:putative FmdB family regulatory protein